MYLTYIDGNGEVQSLEVKAFSPADIATSLNTTFEHYRRNVDDPDDLVVGIAVVDVKETKQTAVQFIDKNGRTDTLIGPTDHFVMDPPFDEEPAYDNYKE